MDTRRDDVNVNVNDVNNDVDRSKAIYTRFQADKYMY